MSFEDWEDFQGEASPCKCNSGVLLSLQDTGHEGIWFLCQRDQKRVQKRRQRPDNDPGVISEYSNWVRTALGLDITGSSSVPLQGS